MVWMIFRSPITIQHLICPIVRLDFYGTPKNLADAAKLVARRGTVPNWDPKRTVVNLVPKKRTDGTSSV